jgi:hypothetical protein
VIRSLKSQGLKVILANGVMTQNLQDYPGVHALAAEMLAQQSAGVSAGQANLSQKNLVQMRTLPASVRNASASASA